MGPRMKRSGNKMLRTERERERECLLPQKSGIHPPDHAHYDCYIPLHDSEDFMICPCHAHMGIEENCPLHLSAARVSLHPHRMSQRSWFEIATRTPHVISAKTGTASWVVTRVNDRG